MVVDGVGSLGVISNGTCASPSPTPTPTPAPTFCSVSTLAGAAAPGLANGVGTSASFKAPTGLAANASSGTLYLADTGSHTVRAISLSTHAVTLVAGSPSGERERLGAGEQGRARPRRAQCGQRVRA
jgi:hypothetical protein